MNDKLYIKKENGRYEAVEPFSGFPANGIWLVEDGKQNLLTYLAKDKPEPFVLNYMAWIDEVTARMSDEWSKKAMSPRDLAEVACRYFAEQAYAEQLKTGKHDF